MHQKPQEVMADFHFISQFFYRALHQQPDISFVEELKKLPFEKIWHPQNANVDIEAGLELLENDLVGAKLESLTHDYAQLFVGPNTLQAAPWASVYLTEDQTVCGEPTLAVKAFYRECGLEIDTGENEPEDHLGLMFAFLAERFASLLTASEQSQPIDQHQDVIRSFLTDHVLTWAPHFLEIMKQNAETDFYRGLALLIRGSLRQMATFTEAEYKIVRLYR